MTAYYNEIDPHAAKWLRNLIASGLIAPGEVDTRSIADVRPGDLAGFTQAHWFAGIGGWSFALRLAGWPDDRAVWSGSCPCQPFSNAGKKRGFDDERHLWPIWRELIRERRPATVFGEQVASATEWLGLVRSDLEGMEYAVGAMPIQAASAGADHLRDRYWFVAESESKRRLEWFTNGCGRIEGNRTRLHIDAAHHCHGIGLADANDAQSQGRLALSERSDKRIVGPDGVADADSERSESGAALFESNNTVDGGSNMGDSGSAACQRHTGGFPATQARECRADGSQHGNRSVRFANASAPAFDWVVGADGKARRVKPGIRLLAHGIPGRVGKLRGFGNAIDPRPAAEFIGAYLDCAPSP